MCFGVFEVGWHRFLGLFCLLGRVGVGCCKQAFPVCPWLPRRGKGPSGVWQGTFSCGSSCLGCRATEHRYPGSKLVFRIGVYLRLWWLLSRRCFLIYLAVGPRITLLFLELPGAV